VSGARELQALAERVGATDVFALRRVAPERVVNLDGHGRGAGWGGNLDLDPAAEPFLTEIMAAGLARRSGGTPQRVFGPYWSEAAVGFLAGEFLVVFGGPGVEDATDDEVTAAGRRVAELVDEVPVAKMLADELEVTKAALAVASMRPSSLREAALGIATAASRSTSCEFGAVLLHGPPMTVHLAEDGWVPSASEEEIISALLPLDSAIGGGLFVEQDVAASPFPYPPLAFQDGLVARCAVRLGSGGSVGLLVVAHTLEAPRGFTMLCQRVMGAIAQAAGSVLEDLVEA
jgi:hypothetical protein